MMPITLADAGEEFTIQRIAGKPEIKAHLADLGFVVGGIMDMGITKGVEIYVRKVAPLGDPIEITVRDYELSVRKGDAELIEVE